MFISSFIIFKGIDAFKEIFEGMQQGLTEMFFSSYSQKIYLLQNLERDKKYGIVAYLQLIESGLLQLATVKQVLVSIFKLLLGQEMMPAGVSTMIPQQSLPDSQETFIFQRKAYIPLFAGQLNITDKKLT